MSTPDPVAGLVRLLNIVGPQPVSAADMLRPQLGDFTTGDYVRAHVLTTLPNGRFHVLVKDQLMDLNLPPNTEPGETLELRVERNDGRLQFSMPAPGGQPQPDQQGAVSLSPAARLLQEALQRTQTQEPARVAGSQPLVEGEPHAAPLAENLRQAVRESGLFYESHQQQWVAGQKPLADLMREPQARLAASLLLDAQGVDVEPGQLAGLLKVAAQATAEQLPAALRDLAAALKQPAAAPDTASMAPHAQAAAEADTAQPSAASIRLQQRLEASGALLPTATANVLAAAAEEARTLPTAQDLSRLMARPEMQNMVQQQIQALETHHLLWQGQVWPGQALDWEIVGEREQEQASQDEAPTRWTSRLAMDLPVLGRVVVHVQLAQGQVSLNVAAESEDTARIMKVHQTRLQQQFNDAQLTLASTHIAQGSDEEGQDGK